MTYTPRPYQRTCIDKGVEFLRQPKPKNGLIVCPTGGGKAIIIAETCLALNEPCVVFQPSKEILEQNLSKFQSYGYRPAVFSASVGEKRVGDKITLATIGSVHKRPEMFAHCKYIIIDEAHGVNAKADNSMFSKFISAMPHARVMGYTATPYRLSTDGYGGSILKFLTRTRPRVFEKVVHVIQNGELFQNGYLAKLEYKQVNTGFRADRLRLNSTGADYTDESVRNLFKELHFSDQIVRCVNRLDELGRGGSIIFTRFVEEAQYVAARVPGGAVVSAETPKQEREQILADFKAGRIRHICNAAVLIYGFDFPALANVVLASPTMSLARYYQEVGRAVRTHPSKENAFIVDMVGLVEKFGRVEDLELVEEANEKWFVRSGGRTLTNTYFGEPPEKRWTQSKQLTFRR